MKIAYSLLLGELIEAVRVEYEDCKNLQITCPECSEPVFKAVKTFRTKETPTHYYAHYEKSKSLTEECELRVGSISDQDIKRIQTEARHQRLKFFLSVFADAVHKMLKTVSESFKKPDKLWWMVEKLKRSKPVAVDLFNPIFAAHKTGFAKMTDEELNEIFEFYADESGVEYLEKFTKNSFSLITQKRIARDFYRYLLSDPARDNFKLLYIAGYFMLYYRTEISSYLNQTIAESFEPMLHKAVITLPELNRNKGKRMLEEMAVTPIYYRNGNSKSLLGKIQSEVSNEMFGVLLRLEYLELLKNAKNESFGSLNDSLVG